MIELGIENMHMDLPYYLFYIINDGQVNVAFVSNAPQNLTHEKEKFK
jgi:hypothetical protein